MWRLLVNLLGALALLMAGHATALADDSKIEPQLWRALDSLGASDEVAVIIQFMDRVAVREFGHRDRKKRRSRLIRALKERAADSQWLVNRILSDRRARGIKQLWMVNKLAARVTADTIDELANRPEIDRIQLDLALTLSDQASPDLPLPGWNHVAIGAQDLWALGFNGQGVVVGIMDSGVDLSHPALTSKWRGGSNSWFDPHGQHATPADLDGHGTQTTGLVLADPLPDPITGFDEDIGVAPGAQWVAVKIFDDSGSAMLSDIHLGFQWLLDPDDDATTDDAPDVVNNSWILQNTINQCDLEFQADIDALRAAEIAVVFSAGNAGPGASTSVSPPNNAGAFPVGAVNEAFNIWQMSSRGPSACGVEAFPRVVAPGVNVQTTDRSFGGILTNPVLVTGTSASAPHVAGGMAILKNAFPGATVRDLEAALEETARDLGEPGPDDAYGAGLIDLFAAYNHLLTSLPTEDRVEIVKTRYLPKRDKLVVIAKSSVAPDADLTLPQFDDARMRYNDKKGHYRVVLRRILAKPASVVVESSEGGSDMAPVPFPDSVTIVKARYNETKQKLIVEARSNAQPEVTLNLPEHGDLAMTYKPDRGLYRKVISNLAEAPKNVTVVSSGGGRDSEPVPFKADRVEIVSASYDAARRRLTVTATSNRQGKVRLTLPEYDVRMIYLPHRELFRGRVHNVATHPSSVTVESSGSGFDIEPVPFPG